MIAFNNLKNFSTGNAVFFACILAVFLCFFLPFNLLLNFSHDDSFYYLKTARNICSGNGSSFDGINTTNGYHPLWMIIMTGYIFILQIAGPLTPETVFRFVTFLHLFICIVISFVSFRILIELYDRKTGVKIFILIFLLYLSFVFLRGVGIESIVNCLTMSLILFVKVKELKSNTVQTYLKAFLLSLLFLGRTDYLITYIPALLAADFITTHKEIRKKNLILEILFVAVTAFIYFSFNYNTFGHFSSISSRKLITFPVSVLTTNLGLIFDTYFLFNAHALRLVLLLSSVIFVSIKIFAGKNNDKKFAAAEKFFLGAGAGSILFCLLHLTFNSEGLREWYVTLPMFTAIMLSVFPIAAFIKQFKIIFIVFLIMNAVILYKTRIDSNKFNNVYEYAKALKENVGQNEPVYQVDFAGITGFFSERKVVNGDGFINSFEYMDFVENGKLPDYLKKYDIKLYSTYTIEKSDFDSVFFDQRFAIKNSGFSFTFTRSDLVLSRDFEFKHLPGERKGNWYLFKIRE